MQMCDTIQKSTHVLLLSIWKSPIFNLLYFFFSSNQITVVIQRSHTHIIYMRMNAQQTFIYRLLFIYSEIHKLNHSKYIYKYIYNITHKYNFQCKEEKKNRITYGNV